MPGDVHAVLSLICGIRNDVLSGHMLQFLAIDFGIKQFFGWCCTAAGFTVSSLLLPDFQLA